jgi:hypothetical protein
MLQVPRDIQVAFDRKIEEAPVRLEIPPTSLIHGEVSPDFCQSSLRKTNRRSDRRKRLGPWSSTMIWLQKQAESRNCAVGSPQRERRLGNTGPARSRFIPGTRMRGRRPRRRCAARGCIKPAVKPSSNDRRGGAVGCGFRNAWNSASNASISRLCY